MKNHVKTDCGFLAKQTFIAANMCIKFKKAIGDTPYF